MRELGANEIQEVNGGIIPFIVAVVAIDVGLISTMLIVQSSIDKK